MIQGNNFYTGLTNIFYVLKNGEIHLRYYGAFIEPGTTAMMILPALIYSLVKRNYIYSITYVFAIFITRGLGGIISLAIITPLYVFYSFRNTLLRYTLIITLILTSLIFSNYILIFMQIELKVKVNLPL